MIMEYIFYIGVLMGMMQIMKNQVSAAKVIAEYLRSIEEKL